MNLDLPFKELGEKVALCVSGGIDSMVLLDLIIKNNHSKNKEIYVLYVNHGISNNADYWGEFVKEKTKEYISKGYKNLSFHSFKLTLKESNEKITEKNCREKRYKVIFDFCLKNNINSICTAHHKNDLYENNFISIFKNRLYSFEMKNKVIKKVNDKEFICYKPLLCYTKIKLKEYALLNNIKHIHDESNDVSDNIRNVLRNELFAKLNNIKGYAQYLKGMENFFKYMNFSLNFYQKIIKNKILPQIGSFLINEEECFSLELKELFAYLNEKETLLLNENKEKVDKEDMLFLIETINLFFFSKTGYYLTGKIKKHLEKNILNTMKKQTFLIVINDNKVCFKLRFNNLEENLNKSYILFSLFKK